MKPIEEVQKSNAIQPHKHMWVSSKDGSRICKICGTITAYNPRFDELLAYHLAA